jgi:protein pelota
VQKFFNLLSTQQGIVTYGEADTMNKLKVGAVDVLLLSDSLDDNKIDEFEREAKQFSSEVRIISTETREGVQLRDMGKVAAILRYEVRS